MRWSYEEDCGGQMKHQGKYLYIYLGRNGVIISVDFDFKGKAYNVEYTFFWSRFIIGGVD